MDGFNAGGDLINTGSIIASVTPGGDGVSIAVVYDGLSFPTITNSGLISADIAIFFQTRYGEHFTINNSGVIEGAIFWNIFDPEPDYTFGYLHLTNSGTIRGDIFAEPTSTGIETIINNGLITGSLDLFGGNDRYDGTHGRVDEIVSAGDGGDILTGGKAVDVFYGDAGNDTLIGNAGNDFLEGGSGNDTLNGGSGYDIASYSEADEGIQVDLTISGAQKTIGAGTDTLLAIEDVLGSEFKDRLAGNSDSNMLLGGGGNDLIDGLGGTDILDGGETRTSI